MRSSGSGGFLEEDGALEQVRFGRDRSHLEDPPPGLAKVLHVVEDLSTVWSPPQSHHGESVLQEGCFLIESEEPLLQEVEPVIVGKVQDQLDRVAVVDGYIQHSSRGEDPLEFQQPGVGEIRDVTEDRTRVDEIEVAVRER